ncbi:transcription factor S [Candidatus Woesearchaeota archaeon]|nr:transcription factor S [Candidatus Woesearchaeota archaeon]
MLFCLKCKGLLIPNKDDPKKVMCASCGYKPRQKKNLSVKEKVDIDSRLEVVDKTIETLPLTEAECPKCTYVKAFYWTAQTRSSDEAETRFFRCQKCRHQWRQYD